MRSNEAIRSFPMKQKKAEIQTAIYSSNLAYHDCRRNFYALNSYGWYL